MTLYAGDSDPHKIDPFEEILFILSRMETLDHTSHA